MIGVFARAGYFITFEGPDGAGKTSVLKEVSERLAKESKRKIVTTREPGGIPIAEKIRTVILDPEMTEWMSEQKLYFTQLLVVNI